MLSGYSNSAKKAKKPTGDDAASQTEDTGSQTGLGADDDVLAEEEEVSKEDEENERKKKQNHAELANLKAAINSLSTEEVETRLKDFHFELHHRDTSEFAIEAIRVDKPNSDEQKLAVCKLLEGAGVKFAQPSSDNDGNLPLHAAAEVDSVLLFRYCENFFLSNPYDQQNYLGDTPLHVASRHGSISVISYIRERTADTFVMMSRVRNRAGLTPYDVACEEYLDFSPRRPYESKVEFRIRLAKEAVIRTKRRDELQRIFLVGNPFFVPVVFYHPDCLEHLAPQMSMQREFQQLAVGDQVSSIPATATATVGADIDMATGSGRNTPPQQLQKAGKKKRKGPDPAEAWESPQRLRRIMAHVAPLAEEGRVRVVIDFPPADRSVLELAHSPEYVRFVEKLAAEMAGSNDVVTYTPRVQSLMQKLPSFEIKPDANCDTLFSEGSFKAASRAAGAVIAAIDSVMKDETRRAFCVVRPPGHHAGRNGLIDEAHSCGFCIFNNVMVGAMYALKKYKMRRIAIVDLDVHHGNGTEEICREHQRTLPPGSSPQFLFLSTHLYHQTPEIPTANYTFYPGSGETSDLVNNLINVPLWPLWRRRRPLVQDGSQTWLEKFYLDRFGRSQFRRVVEERVLPPLRAFHPDLIIVSAGFDAANKDVGNGRILNNRQLEGFDLERDDFFWVSSELAKIAELCSSGRLVSVLEGGYGRMMDNSDKPAVSSSVTAVMQAAGLPTSAAGTDETAGKAKRGPGRKAQQNIDRDVLARNVQGYIEGLCGGLVPRSSAFEALSIVAEQAVKSAQEAAETAEMVDDKEGDGDDNGNDSDADEEIEYLQSDDALALDVSRKSGRVKKAKKEDEVSTKQPKKLKKGELSEEAIKATEMQRNNAIRFLRKVRDLGEKDNLQFLSIISNYKNKTMDSVEVASAVKALFISKPELYNEFNVFLAPTLRTTL